MLLFASHHIRFSPGGIRSPCGHMDMLSFTADKILTWCKNRLPLETNTFSISWSWMCREAVLLTVWRTMLRWVDIQMGKFLWRPSISHDTAEVLANVWRCHWCSSVLLWDENVFLHFHLTQGYLLITEADLRVLCANGGGCRGSSFWTPATPRSESTQRPQRCHQHLY